MRPVLLILVANLIAYSQSVPSAPLQSTDDTISVFELQHKIDPRALKEGRAADSAYAKHNLTAYIQHVEKAVAIDPDYLIARRNLGVAYLMVERYDDAVKQFQDVLRLDPRSVLGYAALSCAYLQESRFADAETAARRALDLDSTEQSSRYYLGLSLTLQHKNDAEALRNLQRVSNRFPKAHVASAEILERLGMKTAAKGQLQEYLSSGDKDVRSQVNSWLSSLR